MWIALGTIGHPAAALTSYLSASTRSDPRRARPGSCRRIRPRSKTPCRRNEGSRNHPRCLGNARAAWPFRRVSAIDANVISGFNSPPFAGSKFLQATRAKRDRSFPNTFFRSMSAPVLPPWSVAHTSSSTKKRPGGLLPSRRSTTMALLKYSIGVHLMFSETYSS